MELNQHFLSMEVVCVPLNWHSLKVTKKKTTAEEIEL